ncbi:WGxxGxxG family protein [Paenibacillus riograndensis]|uniref:Putative secreted protein n=1 Tax=Paenibacillus riograndensis SBR5 TaxID=1073571 RepID=A0A0E4CYG5_9BACL|nr:WGxxGxxG family protein [Paenibacillus riograndensis]CQR57480.1 putative secreted protein [Paenibacillus riograndensis SBR5]
MKKLITTFACGTVLSMSLLGVGYASTATGTTGFDGTGTRMMNEQGNTMMNNTTGTTGTTGTMHNRAGENYNVTPLSNNTHTGRYRATSTTTNTTTGRGSNWGWLGLVGLLGLAGMRSRSGERDRH